MTLKNILFVVFVFLCISERIPLTYAFLPNSFETIPIVLSFEDTQTSTPYSEGMLYLYTLNLSLQTNFKKDSVITIGLAYPSQFIGAVAATYHLPYEAIELNIDQSLELVLNDENYVQSTDSFINGELFSTKVVFNYGKEIKLNPRPCKLIDNDQIYFDQILLREILNQMSIDNMINYTFKSGKVLFSGKIQNFPQITLQKDKSLFRLNISPEKVYYLDSNLDAGTSLIGYKVLTDFSKIKFYQNNAFIFKRTSLLFMLYLFLGYFLFFIVALIIFSKKQINKTLEFVKKILQWVILKNRIARIQVLGTELQ